MPFILSVFILLFFASNLTDACGRPPKFDSHYAKVSRNQDDFELGAEVKYMCKTGFSLRQGDGTAKCVARDGKQVWEGPTLQCSRKTCPTPPGIKNGKVTGTLFVFGGNVTYSCNNGYEPSTNRLNRYCLSNGNWGGPTPECNPVSCPEPEDPVNGRAEYLERTYGQTVTYRCDPSLGINGPRTRTCKADKTWSGSLPICEEVKCQIPSSLPRGKIIASGGNGVGDAIFYVCNEGEIETSAFCKEDGSWSSPPPSCPDSSATTAPIAITDKCKEPPVVENAAHDHAESKREFSLDTKLTYDCKKGCKSVATSSEDTQAVCSKVNGKMVWVGPKLKCTECNLLYIIVGTVVGGVALGVLVVVLICWLRKRKPTSSVFVANGKKEQEKTVNNEETINLNEVA